MENPADYDIEKDLGDEEVDEAKIGNVTTKFKLLRYKLLYIINYNLCKI